MAKKISELPATTTPASSSEAAVNDSGVTKKSTLENIALVTAPTVVRSQVGWFDVGHDGANQSIGATTPTKILVDGLSAFQGGFGNIPSGTTELGLYDKSTSSVLLDELVEGASLALTVSGVYTTTVNDCVTKVQFRFYDSGGSLVFQRATEVYFKSAASHEFEYTAQAFLGPAIVDGHVDCFIEFSKTGNTVDMGGFYVTIIK